MEAVWNAAWPGRAVRAGGAARGAVSGRAVSESAGGPGRADAGRRGRAAKREGPRGFPVTTSPPLASLALARRVRRPDWGDGPCGPRRVAGFGRRARVKAPRCRIVQIRGGGAEGIFSAGPRRCGRGPSSVGCRWVTRLSSRCRVGPRSRRSTTGPQDPSPAPRVPGVEWACGPVVVLAPASPEGADRGLGSCRRARGNPTGASVVAAGPEGVRPGPRGPPPGQRESDRGLGSRRRAGGNPTGVSGAAAGTEGTRLGLRKPTPGRREPDRGLGVPPLAGRRGRARVGRLPDEAREGGAADGRHGRLRRPAAPPAAPAERRPRLPDARRRLAARRDRTRNAFRRRRRGRGEAPPALRRAALGEARQWAVDRSRGAVGPRARYRKAGPRP